MTIRRGTVKNLILSGVILFCLTGCKQKVEQSGVIATEKQVARLSMLDAAEISYEVPVSMPSVIVDTYGYEVSQTKKAFLVSENLPKRFLVKRVSDGAEVFSGTVKYKEVNSGDGLMTGVADFTYLTEEGDYYIETELLGRSLNFSVRAGVYDDLAKKASDRLSKLRNDTYNMDSVSYESDPSKSRNVSGGWNTDAEGGKDVVEGCLAVMDICTAVEYYASVFEDSDENGIPDIMSEAIYEVSWLKRMQNEETGGVFTSVSFVTKEGSDVSVPVIVGETTRATAYYCACMAKYSYTVNKYDRDESSKALVAANMAWQCLTVNKGIVDADQMFRAAVEMYRATGKYEYKTVVDNYLADNAEKEYTGRLVLDGALTYLDTQRSTKVDYCTPLMTNFMKRTENFATGSSESRYAVLESGSMTDLLRSVYELALVEYIISNTTYSGLEEECLHYILGRNEYSNDLSEEINTPDDLVKLIVICGKLSGYVREQEG